MKTQVNSFQLPEAIKGTEIVETCAWQNQDKLGEGICNFTDKEQCVQHTKTLKNKPQNLKKKIFFKGNRKFIMILKQISVCMCVSV